MMNTKIVYVCNDEKSTLFSIGVTRDFGENVVVHLSSGKKILACVLPLRPGVIPHDMTQIGFMYVE